MPYLGKTPSQATRKRYYKTASGSETSISGTMTVGGTLTFTDGEFVDVSVNGVALVAGTDYNTDTANTIAGLSALSANDQVEIVVYDTFSVFSGDVDSNMSVGGNLSVTGTATLTGNADFNGDLDVDGTTNLDVVDIDGAVDMASTLAVSGASTFSSDIDIQGSAGATLKLTSTDTTGADTELLGQIDFVSSDTSTGSAGTQARIKGVYEDNGDSSGLEFFCGASTGSGTPTLFKRMILSHDGEDPAVSIITDDNVTSLELKSTDADGSVGPTLDLKRDSSSPADIDTLGRIRFLFNNDAAEEIEGVRIDAQIGDASDGTEDVGFEIQTMVGGTLSSRMANLVSETVFNEDSKDLDFRIESDTQMASFFVEGSTSNIGIGHNTPTADSSIAGTSVPSGTKYVHVHDGDGAVLKLSDPSDGSNRGAQFAIIGTTAFLNNCESGGLILGSGNTSTMTISGSNDTNFTRSSGVVLSVNRNGDDGSLVALQQGATTEGIISVSGTTITYGGFSGSHWSRLSDNSKPTILRGTVVETIDEMCKWYQAEYEYNKETKKESIALPEGKSVGDTFTYETTTLDPNEKITVTAKIIQEDDVKHAMCKVSDTVDSKKVYGVFLDWDNDEIDEVNDMNICSVGTNLVRIHKDVTVEAGDLLSSNGDGTAKVQDDDIIRSKTIGKVLAAVKQETYSDGSYTVPCALYCG